jgi:hypothetical protein
MLGIPVAAIYHQGLMKRWSGVCNLSALIARLTSSLRKADIPGSINASVDVAGEHIGTQ